MICSLLVTIQKGKSACQWFQLDPHTFLPRRFKYELMPFALTMEMLQGAMNAGETTSLALRLNMFSPSFF